MDHFVALSLNLTTIFHLFPSIRLPTIGSIYNKEVGNYTKMVESKMELEELAIEKLATYLFSNHVTNSVNQPSFQIIHFHPTRQIHQMPKKPKLP
jgi:hypothetical protein